MREECQQHQQAIETIYQLTHGINLPDQACNTRQALYDGLQAFVTDLTVHMYLENGILFTRADNALQALSRG